MRIGEVAAQAKVNIQTVRLYERLGLLKKPGRLASGYRDYPADAVTFIRFIKRTQKLGFTLNEIKTLIELRERGDRGSTRIRDIAKSKLEQIDGQIRRLQAMRDMIDHGLKSCQCSEEFPICLLVNLDNQRAAD